MIRVRDLLQQKVAGPDADTDRQQHFGDEVQQIVRLLAGRLGLEPGTYAVGHVALLDGARENSKYRANATICLASGKDLVAEISFFGLSGKAAGYVVHGIDNRQAGKGDRAYELTLRYEKKLIYETLALYSAKDDGFSICSGGIIRFPDGASANSPADVPEVFGRALVAWLATPAPVLAEIEEEMSYTSPTVSGTSTPELHA